MFKLTYQAEESVIEANLWQNSRKTLTWLYPDILNTGLAGSLENAKFKCQYLHLIVH